MIETSSVLPRKSSEIFGKCSETIVWPSDMFFEDLRKASESVRKSSENRQKKSSLVCFVFNCNLISHLFAALTPEILSLTLEDKIHIQAPACNIPYLNNLQTMVPAVNI